MSDAPDKIFIADLTEFNRTDRTAIMMFSKKYINEEILQPIRDAIEKYHPDGNNEVICQGFRKAISETLAKADK